MTRASDDAELRGPMLEGGPAVHELKCWPEFFEAIALGEKRHDLRQSRDRHFEVGDQLRLREYDPASSSYTGREQTVVVTYITSAERPCALSNEGLHPDFCILSIAPLAG
jgi:hypothetical protein